MHLQTQWSEGATPLQCLCGPGRLYGTQRGMQLDSARRVEKKCTSYCLYVGHDQIALIGGTAISGEWALSTGTDVLPIG